MLELDYGKAPVTGKRTRNTLAAFFDLLTVLRMVAVVAPGTGVLISVLTATIYAPVLPRGKRMISHRATRNSKSRGMLSNGSRPIDNAAL
jgi:hypothetical protein